MEPEQVSHELQGRFPEQPARCLCVESIDQVIYNPDAPMDRLAKCHADAGGIAFEALNDAAA